MRLAYAFRLERQDHKALGLFEAALGHLDHVLSPKVRPNYCFALYEKGRNLRLMGRFNEAQESLEKAKALAPEERDVSVDSIAREISRAAQGDTSFP